MGIQDVAPSFRNPPTFQDLEEVKAYLKDNINKIARSLQDIDFMINGTLDVKNIRADGIEARNIKAEAITTDKLIAGAVTTDKITAGAVTAEKITVGELSAISANLGHIVAGLIESIEIYGSYIATRRNAYPRCEMSATGNVLAAYTDGNNYIAVNPNYAGVPSLDFKLNGSDRLKLNVSSGAPEVTSLGSMDIMSYGGDIRMSPSGSVTFDNWDKLYSVGMGRTLGNELREIFDRLEALEDR